MILLKVHQHLNKKVKLKLTINYLLIKTKLTY